MMNYSVADEIRKLKELLDEGILTQEEFNSQKSKLLSGDNQIQETPKRIDNEKCICTILEKEFDFTELNDLIKSGKYYQAYIYITAFQKEHFKYDNRPIIYLLNYIDENDTIPTEITSDILLTVRRENKTLLLRWKQWEENPSTKEAYKSGKVLCPKCGSTAITTGARGANWTLGLFGASKTVNRCGACGYTWEPRK